MPPYCAAGFTGLLGRALGRLDVNCLTLKGISSPEIMAILSCWGEEEGGALATSYRCVLLRPTRSLCITRFCSPGGQCWGHWQPPCWWWAFNTFVIGPRNFSPGPCHLHSAHVSTNIILQTQTILQYRPPSTHRLPSNQHSSATHLQTVLSPKCGNKGREVGGKNI